MVFLFIIPSIIILITTSLIEIKICNLHIDTRKKKNNKIKKTYKITIKVKILKKIPILKYEITNKKIKQIKEKKQLMENLEKQKNKILKNNIKINKKELKEIIKQMQIKLKDLYLEIEIGTENAAVTALLVPTVSTLISFIIKNNNSKKIKNFYIVKPKYTNQNFIDLKLNGILKLKTIHIINIYVNRKKSKLLEKNNSLQEQNLL